MFLFVRTRTPFRIFDVIIEHLFAIQPPPCYYFEQALPTAQIDRVYCLGLQKID